MKLKIYTLVLLPILILCSGCFEIVEKIKLEDSGKGNYQIIANFSQSKDNIKGLLDNDSIMGQRVPSISEITSEMEKAKNKLASMSGISNVKLTKDFNNYVFNLTCDFTNVNALDQALTNTINAYSKRRKFATGNYIHSSNTFKRQVVYDYTGEASKNMNSQIENALSKATFMAVYQFPKKVKSVSNYRAKISPSGKATMLRVKFIDISRSKRTIENTITFE